MQKFKRINALLLMFCNSLYTFIIITIYCNYYFCFIYAFIDQAFLVQNFLDDEKINYGTNRLNWEKSSL